MPLLNEQRRYILLYGGRDSAKSYFAAQKVLIDTMRKKYSRYILMRKVYADIKDSQLQTIKDIIKAWGLQAYFKINENPIKITFIKNGNIIIARGLDKEAKTKSIKDPTGVWYEEANEISYNDFIKTTTSLRGGLLQEIMTFNPELETEWINTRFFPAKESYEKEDGKFHWVKSIKNDAVILHTTYKDNRYCIKQSADKLESLKTDKDYNYYKIYTLGLWGGTLEGVIFTGWEIIYEMPERIKFVGYGIDWGYSNDPTAIIAVYIKDKELILKEVAYKTGMSNEDITKILKYRKVKPYDEIVADSAEPKSIAYIYEEGFNIEPSIKGPDSIKFGIDKMREYNIKVASGSRNIIFELKNYVWKMDKNGNSLNVPIDKNNHALDAVRYVVLNKLSNWKGQKMRVTGVRI